MAFPLLDRRPQKRLSLRKYPLISLTEARSRRDEKRRMIIGGVDPVALVREQKAAVAPDKFFEIVAREWRKTMSIGR